MTTNLLDREAYAIRAVASGESLASIARALGVTITRARQLLNRACSKLRRPNGVAYIRSHSAEYISLLPAAVMDHQPRPAQLRDSFAWQLRSTLRVPSDSELAPGAVANLTPSQLIAEGFTPVAIAAIHDWLVAHDLHLHVDEIRTPGEYRVLEQSLSLLAAYGLDVAAAREQLQAERADRSKVARARTPARPSKG